MPSKAVHPVDVLITCGRKTDTVKVMKRWPALLRNAPMKSGNTVLTGGSIAPYFPLPTTDNITILPMWLRSWSRRGNWITLSIFFFVAAVVKEVSIFRSPCGRKQVVSQWLPLLMISECCHHWWCYQAAQ